MSLWVADLLVVLTLCIIVMGALLAPFPIRLVVVVTLLVMVIRATLRVRLQALAAFCRLCIVPILVRFSVKLAMLTCYVCLEALATIMLRLALSCLRSVRCSLVVSVLGLCGRCNGCGAPEWLILVEVTIMFKRPLMTCKLLCIVMACIALRLMVVLWLVIYRFLIPSMTPESIIMTLLLAMLAVLLG